MHTETVYQQKKNKFTNFARTQFHFLISSKVKNILAFKFDFTVNNFENDITTDPKK